MRIPAARPLSLLLLLLVAPACLLPRAGAAAQVTGLYEGRVPVSGEDEAERALALGKALRQVVSKLTGMAQPAGAALDEAAAQPQRYLQQFRYLDNRGGDTPLLLWAQFDPGAVDALVREAGLPEWSGQRPGVLAWVVVARGEGLEIVAPDSGEDVARALQGRAWERGVPLSFPLLDLEDRVRIRATDLWSLDTTSIDAASARYTPGAVLVGRLEPSGAGAWVARWRLDEAGNVHEWETRGLSAAAAVPQAVDEAADRLAARHALAPATAGGEGAIQLRVAGVRGVDDYARALAYLQGLDQIRGLQVVGARNDELLFRMQLRGGAEALRRVTEFGGVLAPEPAVQDGGALRFRLLP